jgi:hypothetical protein
MTIHAAKQFRPRSILGTAVMLAVAATGGVVDCAGAETGLDARYTISFARITVGEGVWKIEIGESAYAMSVSAQASGVVRVVASGRGTVTSRGIVKEDRLQPTYFASSTTSDDGASEVRMLLDGGSVKELSARLPPEEEKDRVPLTDAHRQGVVDPLSGLIVPVNATGDVLANEACAQTLPIFDGRRRYDLRLSFKRMDKVKADKGYQGPAVVCALGFHAHAGHRPASTLVKYLADGRDMELWLAPIAGTRFLAPFRLTIAGMLGNMVIHAERFETIATPPVMAKP